jgi:hypothetical protein
LLPSFLASSAGSAYFGAYSFLVAAGSDFDYFFGEGTYSYIFSAFC